MNRTNFFSAPGCVARETLSAHYLTGSALPALQQQTNTMSATDELTEFYDSAEDVSAKVAAVAKMMTASKFSTLYTGAGLSTSAGIPDFRGPNGVWTLKAQGRRAAGADLMKCNPTVGHMVCKALLESQDVNFICSQNVDGLHRRSGVPREKLSELHGNTNLETCENCGQDYFRDFETRRPGIGVFEHKTGRKCEAVGCNGDLADSIINFGEDLPKEEWAKAEAAFQQADLCIVLGSSCKVTPAAYLPKSIGQRGTKDKWTNLVIVNLQRTPLDHLASVKVHARTDDFLSLLAHEMGISAVDAAASGAETPQLQLPTPGEILKTVEMVSSARNSKHPCLAGATRVEKEALPVEIQKLSVSEVAKRMLRGA